MNKDVVNNSLVKKIEYLTVNFKGTEQFKICDAILIWYQKLKSDVSMLGQNAALTS